MRGLAVAFLGAGLYLSAELASQSAAHAEELPVTVVADDPATAVVEPGATVTTVTTTTTTETGVVVTVVSTVLPAEDPAVVDPTVAETPEADVLDLVSDAGTDPAAQEDLATDVVLDGVDSEPAPPGAETVERPSTEAVGDAPATTTDGSTCAWDEVAAEGCEEPAPAPSSEGYVDGSGGEVEPLPGAAPVLAPSGSPAVVPHSSTRVVAETGSAAADLSGTTQQSAAATDEAHAPVEAAALVVAPAQYLPADAPLAPSAPEAPLSAPATAAPSAGGGGGCGARTAGGQGSPTSTTVTVASSSDGLADDGARAGCTSEEAGPVGTTTADPATRPD